MRSGGAFVTSRPCQCTVPFATGTNPISARISVVLPMPLRPSRPSALPAGRSRLTPRSVWLSP